MRASQNLPGWVCQATRRRETPPVPMPTSSQGEGHKPKLAAGCYQLAQLGRGSRWQGAVQCGDQQQDEADSDHDPGDAVDAAVVDGGVKDDPGDR